MRERKKILKYYFSVEGECEQWYLEWLKNTINNTSEASHHVSFDSSIQRNPLKRAKSIVITSKIDIWHLFDYESNDHAHRLEFQQTIDNMKAAKSIGKQINYKLGYSNFTFDLWILLHKIDTTRAYNHRKGILSQSINRAFHEHYASMNEFKKEANFKKCLLQLSLSNVKKAVDRSSNIMKNNQKNGYILHEYKGYPYYYENPSLSIWEIIRKILLECNLM